MVALNNEKFRREEIFKLCDKKKCLEQGKEKITSKMKIGEILATHRVPQDERTEKCKIINTIPQNASITPVAIARSRGAFSPKANSPILATENIQIKKFIDE